MGKFKLKEITPKVEEIIRRCLSIDESEIIIPNNDFDDLLDVITIIMKIEKEFEIRIPDEETEKMNNMQKIIDYLVSLD